MIESLKGPTISEKHVRRLKERGVVANIVRFVIDKIFWTSPYRWIDEWEKRVQERFEPNSENWIRIRDRRYTISELYIIGWLGIAIALLVFNQLLPIIFVYILMWRVVGILNKEMGVVLFGICKITEGRKVSASPRVVLLALSNYLTAGLLFALLYSKVGTYQVDGSLTVSGLSISFAIVQAFSVLFTLSPAYAPADLRTRLLTIGQGAFCYLFGVLIISNFVTLLSLKTELEPEV